MSVGFALLDGTVIRKLEHRLDQVNDRLHILEGLLIVYLNLDKVIKIIRESDEPKKDIITAFKLSDIQANAILEIRLRPMAPPLSSFSVGEPARTKGG